MALAKQAYAVSNFTCAIDGVAAGFLNSFDPPTMEVDKISVALGPDCETQQALGNLNFGDAKASINPAHSAAWLTVINSVFDKACTEFQIRVDLADHNYKSKRAIAMAGCLIKKIGLGKLAAGDGKKLWDMSFEWESEDVIYEKGTDAVIQGVLGTKNKNWLCSNFEPMGMPGGIEANSVIDIDCGSMSAKVGKEHVGMLRQASKHYTKWDVDGVKSTHSSIAYNTALAYVNKVIRDGAIQDEEYAPWSVDLKDQTFKTVLGSINYTGSACQKFTWSPQLKSGDTMSNFTIDWVVQTIRFEPKHK